MIHRSQDLVPQTVIAFKSLINVPLSLRMPMGMMGASVSDMIGEYGAKPFDPMPDTFMTNFNVAIMKQSFEFPIAVDKHLSPHHTLDGFTRNDEISKRVLDQNRSLDLSN